MQSNYLDTLSLSLSLCERFFRLLETTVFKVAFDWPIVCSYNRNNISITVVLKGYVVLLWQRGECRLTNMNIKDTDFLKERVTRSIEW